MSSRDPSINITLWFNDNGLFSYSSCFKYSWYKTVSARSINHTRRRKKTIKKVEKEIKVDNFGNIETTDAKSAKINKEALIISETMLMGLTIPLAFGYIIGFDCSCPPNENHNLVRFFFLFRRVYSNCIYNNQ